MKALKLMELRAKEARVEAGMKLPCWVGYYDMNDVFTYSLPKHDLIPNKRRDSFKNI